MSYLHPLNKNSLRQSRGGSVWELAGGEFLYELAYGKFAGVSVTEVWELAGGEFLYELAYGKFAGFRKS